MKTNFKGWIAMYAPSAVPGYSADGPHFHWFDRKPNDANWVPVCEHTFEVELPADFDPLAGAIGAIDETIRQARAEFQKRITELQEQKQRLLAITMETA